MKSKIVRNARLSAAIIHVARRSRFPADLIDSARWRIARLWDLGCHGPLAPADAETARRCALALARMITNPTAL